MSMLSASEPPSPSSDSSISTSRDSVDCIDLCESPRLASPGLVVPNGWVCTETEPENGDVGKGLCPFIPPKSLDVGVLGVDLAGSSVEVGVAVEIGLGIGIRARGVVGVVASLE